MFLIGSRAAAIHGLEMHRDTSKSDWDIIGSKFELENFRLKFPFANYKESTTHPGKWKIQLNGALIEFDATENPSNKILDKIQFNVIPYDPMFEEVKTLVLVPSKEILYQIKLSHVNFGVHFMKTITDVRSMMKQWDMYARENYHRNTEFFKARYAEAKERDGARQERIKLNKPNEDFFKGGMSLRTYVHDDLHRAVAYVPGFPTFEQCKKDLSSAYISRELFDNLPYDMKLNMAMEESMVIALEREYIPKRHTYKTMTAQNRNIIYRAGLLKEIKDLSKGWFQNFMIDHLLELEKPKWNFIERFEDALASGHIKEI